MKKDLFKRKVATAVACLMFGATAVALAGCSETPDPYEKDETTHQLTVFPRGTYIAITENGVTTLHKGIGYTKYDHTNYKAFASAMMTFVFDCDPNTEVSSTMVNVYSTMPDSSKFDVACECAQ